MNNLSNFWIIAIPIFIATILLIAKFTLKKSRAESNDREWRLWSGRSTYWRIVTLCSIGTTTLIMYSLKWIGVITF